MSLPAVIAATTVAVADIVNLKHNPHHPYRAERKWHGEGTKRGHWEPPERHTSWHAKETHRQQHRGMGEAEAKHWTLEGSSPASSLDRRISPTGAELW